MKWTHLIVFCSIMVLQIIQILLHGNVFLSNAFYIFATLLFLLFTKIKVSHLQFMNIFNISYLIYLSLSIGVFMEIIPLNRDLNLFELDLLDLNVKTFIGFYGSTAAIDAYSAICVVLNIVFYEARARARLLIIVAALSAMILTFRSSPYLVLIAPIICIYFTRLVSHKISIPILNTIIFGSFCIPLIFHQIFDNDQLDLIINIGTTGRAQLWNEILELFGDAKLNDQLLGFGNTDSFEVFVWNDYHSNPHNSYFRVLLENGLIIYVISWITLTFMMIHLPNKKLIVIYAILISGISNTNVFTFMNLPVVFLLIYYMNDKETVKVFSKNVKQPLSSA